MYYGNNYYSPFPQQQSLQYFQQQNGALKGRLVSSIEEARASQIDFDGTVSFFPDIANKKIYTKQINLDGTASIKVYALVENADSVTPTYITREEFDSAIKNIENSISQMEVKQNESNSKTVSKPALPF